MLGEGIAKGFVETARNFFGSYVSKDRLTTVQFPEERLPQAVVIFDYCNPDASDWRGAREIRAEFRVASLRPDVNFCGWRHPSSSL